MKTQLLDKDPSTMSIAEIRKEIKHWENVKFAGPKTEEIVRKRLEQLRKEDNHGNITP